MTDSETLYPKPCLHNLVVFSVISLFQASHYSSSVDRMLLVVIFTISPYSSTVGRTYKPFNPLLGETFELSHRGFKFLAEQVGHHPPVTAYHASAEEFEAYGHLTVGILSLALNDEHFHTKSPHVR